MLSLSWFQLCIGIAFLFWVLALFAHALDTVTQELASSGIKNTKDWFVILASAFSALAALLYSFGL